MHIKQPATACDLGQPQWVILTRWVIRTRWAICTRWVICTRWAACCLLWGFWSDKALSRCQGP